MPTEMKLQSLTVISVMAKLLRLLTVRQIDLFVKYTEDFSMANLKEFMISVQYMLASKKVVTIEDAVIDPTEKTSVMSKKDKAKYGVSPLF